MAQGAVLSPLLFSIYINNIQNYYNKNKNYSLLFAKIKAMIKNYLLNLERWLNKWRLSMSAPKCNYIIFNQSNNTHEEIDIKLYNESIPLVSTIKFLGVTFDSRLSFKDHLIEVSKKCHERLNMIKILSHKYWLLNKETLKIIYMSLIRSVLDYSSFIIPLLNTTSYKRVQAIQNIALKTIYRLPRLMHP